MKHGYDKKVKKLDILSNNSLYDDGALQHLSIMNLYAR